MEKLWTCAERRMRQLCAAACSIVRLGMLALSLAGMLYAAAARGDPDFEIRSPDVVIGGVVTGDSVKINITAPSNALIQRTALMLNGQDVTWALLPDGTAGSMT